MWIAEEVTESRVRAEQAALFPLGPSPTYSATQCCGLPCPGKYLRLLPLLTGAPRQRNVAQMKEQIKAPKIELSHEEIASLSDAEFKILVIRMLTKMVEYGRKIEEEVKAMLRETKENIQGTNSVGEETGTQINNLKQKAEINI